MKTTLFSLHGSSIHDNRRTMLEKGKWDGFRILRHEQRTDGTFAVSDFYAGSCFVYKKKLYYVLFSMFSSQINSFFELNTDKQKCIVGTCGVYYEVV